MSRDMNRLATAIDNAFKPRRRTPKELHARSAAHIVDHLTDELDTLLSELGIENVDTEAIGDVCSKTIRQWEEQHGL